MDQYNVSEMTVASARDGADIWQVHPSFLPPPPFVHHKEQERQQYWRKQQQGQGLETDGREEEITRMRDDRVRHGLHSTDPPRARHKAHKRRALAEEDLVRYACSSNSGVARGRRVGSKTGAKGRRERSDQKRGKKEENTEAWATFTHGPRRK